MAFPEVVDLGPFLTPRGGATGGAGCAGGAVQNGAGGVVVGRSRSAVDLSHTHTQRANGIDGEGGSQHHHHPGPHPSHSHDGSRPHPHAQHASPSGSGPGAASSPSSPPQPPSRSLYTLTGVLVHQGASLHGGHYYALVRDSQVGVHRDVREQLARPVLAWHNLAAFRDAAMRCCVSATVRVSVATALAAASEQGSGPEAVQLFSSCTLHPASTPARGA